MIKGILIAVVLLLAVSGVCEIIHTIRSWLFSLRRPINSMQVIVLDEIKAINQLKFVLEQYRWSGNDYAEYIIAATDNISEKTLLECERIFENSPIVFSPLEFAPVVIKSLMKGNHND